MNLLDRYAALKDSLSDATGASEELLHVHFGLLIFVAVALLFRRRLHSGLPLAAVIVFAFLNELVDATAEGWRPLHSILDLANTVFWPAVLFLVARRRRGRAV